jgi:hypothetical protein
MLSTTPSCGARTFLRSACGGPATTRPSPETNLIISSPVEAVRRYRLRRTVVPVAGCSVWRQRRFNNRPATTSGIRSAILAVNQSVPAFSTGWPPLRGRRLCWQTRASISASTATNSPPCLRRFRRVLCALFGPRVRASSDSLTALHRGHQRDAHGNTFLLQLRDNLCGTGRRIAPQVITNILALVWFRSRHGCSVQRSN